MAGRSASGRSSGKGPGNKGSGQQGLVTPQLDIVHEDEDVLVVAKPAGLLTATVPGEKRETLLAHVTTYLAQTASGSRVGLIHRLDRDVQGLLVFSKHAKAYHWLKVQLKQRIVKRVYHAVVQGTPKPASGTYQSNLVEREDGSVSSGRNGQLAITHYETLEVADGRSLVKVQLETGRKHQIRVHMAEHGCPIVGDTLYGRPGRDQGGTGRTGGTGGRPDIATVLLLAATELTIVHPRTKTAMTFTLPLPRRFRIKGEQPNQK